MRIAVTVPSRPGNVSSDIDRPYDISMPPKKKKNITGKTVVLSVNGSVKSSEVKLRPAMSMMSKPVINI